MERQPVLPQGDHRFAFVDQESVLRTAVCGLEAMAGQLDHLSVCPLLPSVSTVTVGEHRRDPGTDQSERWPAEDFWIFDEATVNVELVSSHLTLF